MRLRVLSAQRIAQTNLQVTPPRRLRFRDLSGIAGRCPAGKELTGMRQQVNSRVRFIVAISRFRFPSLFRQPLSALDSHGYPKSPPSPVAGFPHSWRSPFRLRSPPLLFESVFLSP